MVEQKHSYTLHYFDLRGRGEPIRLILEYYGVKYEDNRIAMDDWPKHKADAPLGQVPYLVVDEGKLTLSQTLAICRYLAKSVRPSEYFGGATKSDAARCDMYADAFMDLFSIGVERIYEHDPQLRMSFSFTLRASSRYAKKDALFEQKYPNQMKTLEDHLNDNGGNNFVGKKTLWCDLVALCVLSLLEETKADILHNYPDLHKFYMNMRELPEIKDYIERAWPPATPRRGGSSTIPHETPEAPDNAKENDNKKG
ncbi:hypothetical protein Q1695_006807 [Nippostrongylus brasiliensis]|nr:hypothetical protein Q1695_006807 [Nippostrongylus brasiliensis]